MNDGIISTAKKKKNRIQYSNDIIRWEPSKTNEINEKKNECDYLLGKIVSNSMVESMLSEGNRIEKSVENAEHAHLIPLYKNSVIYDCVC